MKKSSVLIFLLFTCILIGSVAVNAHERTSFSWYSIRNKDHMQPKIDEEMQFIEEYDGHYIDRHHNDSCDKKKLYLTFDAGYENGNIAKILDTLKEEAVPGAFFVLGNLVESNPELIRRMSDEGHLICNHTYSHKDITKITKEEFKNELDRLNAILYECTGREADMFFRPPEGKFSKETMRWSQEFGYKTVFWSFAYADWDNNKQMSPDAAKEKILSNIHNGAILLLHPTSKTNALILGDIIRELKEQNYEFGTLDELVSSS